MKVRDSTEWVPATPEHILACIQQQWRDWARSGHDLEAGSEPSLPTFDTTVHQWREALDLAGWCQLGQELNRSWGTSFSAWRWFSALVPATERTLRGVCELLASQARRPRVWSTKILGRECATAGLFLTIRSLLVHAGAPRILRPSTSLAPYLGRWPGVFLEEVSRLSPGGLPFARESNLLPTLAGATWLIGWLLLLVAALVEEPALLIAGVLLFATGWVGAWVSVRFLPGRLTLEDVPTFRELTELILEREQRSGASRLVAP